MALQWELSTVFNKCFSAGKLIVISMMAVAISAETVNPQQQESELNSSQISFSARDLMLSDSDKDVVNEFSNNEDFTPEETDLIGQSLSNPANNSFSAARGPYIGIILGPSFSASEDLIQTGTDFDGFEIDSTRLVIGAQAGYAFENGLRLEAEARYRQQDVDDTPQDFNFGGLLGNNTVQFVDSDVQSTSIVANVYYDFVQFHRVHRRITPYIKAGVGIAINSADVEIDVQPLFSSPFVDTRALGSECDDAFCFEDETLVQFAWNIGAGVAFQISEQLTADLEYQYIDFSGGDIEFDALGNEIRFEGLSAHEVTFGLRYAF